MRWHLSNQCDPLALVIADRHYSRKSPGSPGFMPPGRQVVLLNSDATALWAASWPQPELVKRKWAGSWMCTLFRNESKDLSSVLITEAVAVTRYLWGEPPDSDGFAYISMIDRDKVRPTMVRGKPVWGWSWFKAGWEVAGETKVRKLLVIGLRPELVPPPVVPNYPVGSIFADYSLAES